MRREGSRRDKTKKKHAGAESQEPEEEIDMLNHDQNRIVDRRGRQSKGVTSYPNQASYHLERK